MPREISTGDRVSVVQDGGVTIGGVKADTLTGTVTDIISEWGRRGFVIDCSPSGERVTVWERGDRTIRRLDS